MAQPHLPVGKVVGEWNLLLSFISTFLKQSSDVYFYFLLQTTDESIFQSFIYKRWRSVSLWKTRCTFMFQLSLLTASLPCIKFKSRNTKGQGCQDTQCFSIVLCSLGNFNLKNPANPLTVSLEFSTCVPTG